jgi:hypothetical protein
VSSWNSSRLTPISSKRGGAAVSLCGQGTSPLPFSLCISFYQKGRKFKNKEVNENPKSLPQQKTVKAE